VEPLEFWGITFRSASHLAYFKLSVTVFLASIGWCFGKSIFSGRFAPTRFWNIMGVAHSVVSLQAAVYTKMGQANDLVYSAECVWFNALAAFLYFFLYWLVCKFSGGSSRA